MRGVYTSKDNDTKVSKVMDGLMFSNLGGLHTLSYLMMMKVFV